MRMVNMSAPSEDAIWKLYGYVVRSEYRKLIVERLHSKPAMPKEIAQATNKPRSHISRALRELEDMTIVICINPQEKKGRIYRLTEKGKQIAKMILET